MLFKLAHQEARRRALQAVQNAQDGWVVMIKPPTRSLEQNARLWALLTCLSEQVEWFGQKLAADDWKQIATAGLKRYRMVPGIDGGFVALGQSTSAMTVAELSELMEFVEAFGAEKGVDFGEPEA